MTDELTERLQKAAHEACENSRARFQQYMEAVDKAGHAHGYARGFREGFRAAMQAQQELVEQMQKDLTP